MLNKLLLCSSFTLMLGACSTEFSISSSDVPAVVQSSFQHKYANAQNVCWEVEKVNGHLGFEAAFKVDGKRKEAYFMPDGVFVSEE